MKVTIYTIQKCDFCKALKDYFTAKGVQYDEKDVEKSKDALTEMLQLSNNFAGVPFTVIVKDDGTKAMLKGFTKGEFDKELGFLPGTQAPQPQGQDASVPMTEEKKKIDDLLNQIDQKVDPATTQPSPIPPALGQTPPSPVQQAVPPTPSAQPNPPMQPPPPPPTQTSQPPAQQVPPSAQESAAGSVQQAQAQSDAPVLPNIPNIPNLPNE